MARNRFELDCLRKGLMITSSGMDYLHCLAGLSDRMRMDSVRTVMAMQKCSRMDYSESMQKD